MDAVSQAIYLIYIAFSLEIYNRLIESLQTVKKRAPLIILVLLICYDLHHGLSV